MEVSQPGATASSSPPVITLKIIYHRQKIFRVTFYSGTYQSGYVDKISAKMSIKCPKIRDFGATQFWLCTDISYCVLRPQICNCGNFLAVTFIYYPMNPMKVVCMCILTPSRADVRPNNSYYANIFTAKLNKNICYISHVKCCVTLSTEGQCQ